MKGKGMVNPARLDLLGSEYVLWTPCCATHLLVPNSTDLDAARQVGCPLCELKWTVAAVSDVRYGLRVSWRPAQ
ncbi:MAG: hypothetical protein ACRDZO_03430 [Egibacteraceae bacterium]